MNYQQALNLKAIVAAMLYDRCVYSVRNGYVYHFEIYYQPGYTFRVSNVSRTALSELRASDSTSSGFSHVCWQSVVDNVPTFTHYDQYYETLSAVLHDYSSHEKL
jgi:hypothetical protein